MSKEDAKPGLVLSVLLAFLSEWAQYVEYREATFRMRDGNFGRCFYFGTGFQGLHVIFWSHLFSCLTCTECGTATLHEDDTLASSVPLSTGTSWTWYGPLLHDSPSLLVGCVIRGRRGVWIRLLTWSSSWWAAPFFLLVLSR